LITSDQHANNWSAFSKPDPDGVNNRLRVILDELVRAHVTLANAGGTQSFYGGDLFHIRGKIEPSVFNPTSTTIANLHDTFPNLRTHAIPGNHDLEGNDASELGNAMQQLANIGGFSVYCKPKLVGDVFVIPWIKDLNHLRLVITEFTDKQFKADLAGIDLLIHAPLNGVIKGLPDHGLDPAELAAFGFRRVFCGHYHNHVERAPGVYSIGATSHQTWSDPGTKAGFMLVYEDRVEFHESHAPRFVDLDQDTLADLNVVDEVNDLVKGNYVRIKLVDPEEKDIRSWRDDTIAAGAAGVQIIPVRTATVTRSGATAKAAISLAASVEHYIANDLKPLLLPEVQALAQEVLAEAQA
jgi:hypothetical protein